MGTTTQADHVKMAENAQQQLFRQFTVDQSLVVLIKYFAQAPGLTIQTAVAHGARHLHPAGDLRTLAFTTTAISVHLDTVALRVSNGDLVAIFGIFFMLLLRIGPGMMMVVVMVASTPLLIALLTADRRHGLWPLSGVQLQLPHPRFRPPNKEVGGKNDYFP